MSELFSTSGSWYKGNLHMHTQRSDGRISPEEAIRLYKNAGYDFIALTDHWAQSDSQMQDDFLIMSGCEYDTGDMITKPIFHIIGAGMDRQVNLALSHMHDPQKIIDAVNEAGGIAILAHPAWSVTNPSDCMPLTGLCGVEIFNSTSDLPWNGRRADSSIYVDIWATQGKLIHCVAGDDSHSYNGEQARSYIAVKANDLSEKSIKDAMKKGDFYASQGPEFRSVNIEEKTIEVSCVDVKTIVFYSNTVWCEDRVFTGGVNHAQYKIKDTDRYVRIELIDDNGNMAWSSPIAVNTKR